MMGAKRPLVKHHKYGFVFCKVTQFYGHIALFKTIDVLGMITPQNH